MKYLIILLLIVITGCSTDENQITMENKSNETIIIKENNTQIEPEIEPNYDGNNVSLVKGQLFDKMNQYRELNQLRNLTYSSSYQDLAKEEMNLYYNLTDDYQYEKWQKILYGRILFNSTIKNCENTMFSQNMSECILKDFKVSLRNSREI